MAEFAQVSSVEGNKIKLKMYKNEACKHCHACDFGAGGKEVEIMAINECGAVTGDTVELFIKKEKFLNAVIIMYVFPLFSLFIGIALGYFINLQIGSQSDLMPVLLGFLFTFIAFLLVKSIDKSKLEAKYTPMAIKVIK